VDARIAWAVNLQHLDPPLIDNEVATAVAAFGPNLYSIQCGNEPNLLFTGYAAFKTSFDSCRDAVGSKAKISGPTRSWRGRMEHQFAADEASA